MKTRILLLIFVTFVSIHVVAQADYSNYLNKALEKMEAGDCSGAQKFYNIYKELSGKSSSSVEVLLNDCQKEKAYSVGETMMVGDKAYTVAYIRDGGKHGYAVLNQGWKDLRGEFSTYITQKGIPTLEELKLILQNRDAIRFYDRYWSCTYDSNNSSLNIHYYMTIDFSTGEVESRHENYANGVILLIHRF